MQLWWLFCTLLWLQNNNSGVYCNWRASNWWLNQERLSLACCWKCSLPSQRVRWPHNISTEIKQDVLWVKNIQNHPPFEQHVYFRYDPRTRSKWKRTVHSQYLTIHFTRNLDKKKSKMEGNNLQKVGK